MFEFCFKQLLSRLDKSASRNILFIYTNTRSTFYLPGETSKLIQKLLNDIKNNPCDTSVPIVIPFNNENTFCMDNEAYRFLIACKNNIVFNQNDKMDFTCSWNKSVAECIR